MGETIIPSPTGSQRIFTAPFLIVFPLIYIGPCDAHAASRETALTNTAREKHTHTHTNGLGEGDRDGGGGDKEGRRTGLSSLPLSFDLLLSRILSSEKRGGGGK